MKTRLALLGAVFAAAVANASTSGFLPVGTKAPDFIAYTATDQPVKLSDFAGKVVLINFWASWCYPSKEMMPLMETLHKQHGRSGLVVLGLCVFDDSTQFKNFVRSSRNDTTYPLVLDRGGNSPSSIARKLYNVTGTPSYYLIGRDGRVVFAGMGADAQTQSALLAAIGKLGLTPQGPSLPASATKPGPVPVRNPR